MLRHSQTTNDWPEHTMDDRHTRRLRTSGLNTQDRGHAHRPRTLAWTHKTEDTLTDQERWPAHTRQRTLSQTKNAGLNTQDRGHAHRPRTLVWTHKTEDTLTDQERWSGHTRLGTRSQTKNAGLNTQDLGRLQNKNAGLNTQDRRQADSQTKEVSPRYPRRRRTTSRSSSVSLTNRKSLSREIQAQLRWNGWLARTLPPVDTPANKQVGQCVFRCLNLYWKSSLCWSGQVKYRILAKHHHNY